jgi:hypothetical protein
MIPQAAHYGDGYEESPSGNITLKYRNGRIQTFNPSTTIDAALPVETGLALGGPYFILINISSNTITVKTSVGSAVGTLAQDELATIGLHGNTDGDWSFRKRSIRGSA